MPQTPSASGSGTSRAGPMAGPHFAQSTTSRTRTRTTIRLPDLSAPLERGRAVDRPINDSDEVEMPSEATATLESSDPEAAPKLPATREPLRSLLAHPLAEKCIAYVQQPKFWLACIVAVAVQVVLAAVMTPADGDSQPPTPRQTSAKRWSKPAAAPATRIVVPPAPTPADVEPADGLQNGTTTPLGVTAPLDGLSDVNATGGQASSDAGPLELLTPPARMADSRRLTDAGPHFDGRTAQSHEGATLGAIVPLEPSPEPNRNEQPQ